MLNYFIMTNSPETPSTPELPSETAVQIDPELYAKLQILEGILNQSDVFDAEASRAVLGTSEPTIDSIVNNAVRSYLEGVMDEFNRD